MVFHLPEKIDANQYIEIIKKKILKEKEKIKLSKIILFGSYARGDNNSNSDIDLLFVTDKNATSVREIKYQIERILDDRIYPLDILVYKEDDLENEKDLVGTLPYNVLKEGKVLYERRW